MTKLRITSCLLAMLCVAWFVQASALASTEKSEKVATAPINVRLSAAISKLNREAKADPSGPSLIASLIQQDYGIRDEDINWAASTLAKLEWGQIAAFAYIHATTGRSFEDLVRENADADFVRYAETAGMNSDKMAHSLETFTKRAETERNSRILAQLRASRRIHSLPDLGSGFGLFQEALDFRRIDSPRPIKIHDDPGVRTK
jgi:hypothetical protein